MPDFYETKLAEALVPQMSIVDTDDAEWRPLTAGHIQEELQPETRDRMVKYARYMYLTNPMAKRIFELLSNFTVGGGAVSFRATDKRVQKLLDSFWNDPINRWPEKLAVRAKELSIYGELCMPVDVNPVTGKVRVKWLSPLDIKECVVDPRNIEIVRSLILRSDSYLEKPITISIINYDPIEEVRTGEAFWYAINKCSDATRGTSDILPIIDWLGLYDEVLFNVNERIAHMSTWLWDVSVAGGTDPEIRKLTRELEAKKIRPGSFRVHNDRIAYMPISPTLVPGDVSEAARMFKVYILGGAGMPEHFFGETTSNKSSSAEMSETAFKMFEERQSLWKCIISDMFNFVIDQAIVHQMLPKRVPREFDVIMPRVSKREIQRAGGSILRVAQTLDVALKQNLIDREVARKVFLASIDQMGLDMTFSEEELSNIDANIDKDKAKDQANSFNQQKKMMALKPPEPKITEVPVKSDKAKVPYARQVSGDVVKPPK